MLWDQTSKVSNSLTKTVNSLASKTLACVPKGLNEMFCVETILDIQGKPVKGAVVQFSRTPLGNIMADSVKHGGFDTTGQDVLGKGDELNSIRIADRRQRSGGRARDRVAAWSVRRREGREHRHPLQREPARRLPLRAHDACVPRQRLRHHAADGPGGGGGSTGGGGGASTGGNAPAGSTATVVSLAGAPVPAATSPVVTAKAAVVAKVVSAQLLVQKGNRYLQLRVKSPLAKAKVRIVLIGKNGKTSRIVLRTIATNRMVVVPNLKLGKLIKSVRVSVA